MHTKNIRSRSVAVLCLLAISLVLGAIPTFAASPDVVISQVYGGGGNSGAQYKNDFIELFNRGTAPVDLAGWSVQYGSSTGTSWSGITPLSGTIQPGQYYLVQEAAGSNTSLPPLPTPDATGSFNMSGTTGKVLLARQTTAFTGACPLTDPLQNATIVDFVGFGSANCSETATVAVLSNTTAAIRTDVCADGDNNSTDFSVSAPAPHNSATPISVCGGAPISTNPSGTGLATPNSIIQGSTTLLTVKVTPGQNPDSTGIVVLGDLSTIGGSTAQQFYDDGTNGDVTAGDGTYSYLATVSGGSTGTLTLPVTITDSQSRTGTAAIALTVSAPATAYAIHDIQSNGDASPLNGQRVMTSGIVVALASNGFYLEAPEAQQDADPATSEGVFIYKGNGVAVGDSVDVTGTVQEYTPSGSALSTTEISSPAVTVNSHSNQLPAAVDVAPDPAGPADQFERYEGMLVHLVSPQITGPTGGTTKTDGIFYATLASLPRPFREPGIEPGIALPTGMPANVPHFDGNPERVKVDTSACAAPVTAAVGDAVSDVTGALGYTGDFTIYACPTVTSQAAAVPLPDRTAKEFTVASFNMLNFTNDPVRLTKASKAIRDIMRMPDVIGVEEMNNLTTLQALADKINSDAQTAGDSNPNYAAQLLSPSGSQNVGFLYRADRITDVTVVEVGRDLLMPDGKNVLNDRPPLVMTAKVTTTAGQTFPVTIIVNHLRSLIDVDTVGSSGDFARTKRQLGAEYLAGLIAQHQSAGENVISVGDYNAYEFNDGYVDVLGTVTGKPTPDDQVLLASQDLVDPDLTDMVLTLPAEKRYSYVENGNAQTLDHIVVTPSLLTRPYHLEIAHNNAEFPGTLGSDATRPERVSDHDMPVAYFTLPDYVPAAILSATSIDFGDMNISTQAISRATSKWVHLSNTGAAPLHISSVDVTGDGFSATNDCGTEVAPGGECTITVTFSPTTVGPKSGTVTVTDDAADSPQALALSGNGTQSGIAISATTFDFGGQIVSTSSTAQTFTITSNGTGALELFEIHLNDTEGNFNMTTTCQTGMDGAMAPGKTCTVSVVFKPGTTGTKTASVAILDDAPVSGTIALAGSGTDFTVGAASGGTTSSTVTAGSTATYNLQFAPVSGFNGTVAFGCSGVPSAATCAVTPTSINVTGSNPGTSTVTVTVITKATTTVAGMQAMPGPGSGSGTVLFAFAMIGLGGMAVVTSRRMPALRIAGACTALLFAMVLTSCGGKSTTQETKTLPGTPAGTYTVTVTATSGTVTHTVPLTLTVK